MFLTEKFQKIMYKNYTNYQEVNMQEVYLKQKRKS